MWKDLDCLQPQKKMLKRFVAFPSSFCFQFPSLFYANNVKSRFLCHVRGCFDCLSRRVFEWIERAKIGKTMNYLFTSESVSEGHPDKIADQISDALLDEFLAYDPTSKVACETLVTTGQVVLAGEVKSKAYVDAAEVARKVIADIGYTKSEYQFEARSCGVYSSIHEQSDDINRGVDQKEDPMDQGAGDQGMMFGYATSETDNMVPLSLDLSHSLLEELASIRKNEPELMPYLRPDSKSQVTIEYASDGTPFRIDTIVISTQHDEFELPENGTKEAALRADRK